MHLNKRLSLKVISLIWLLSVRIKYSKVINHMNYVKIDKLLFIARRLYNVWRMVFCLDYGVFTIIWRFWLLEVRGLSTVRDRWCSIIRICCVFDAHQWSCLQYTNGMLSKNVLCNSRIPGIYTTTINLLYITSYTYYQNKSCLNAFIFHLGLEFKWLPYRKTYGIVSVHRFYLLGTYCILCPIGILWRLLDFLGAS